MASPSIVATCASIGSSFLQGFASVEIKTILAAAKQRRYAANSVILNQGNPADHLFLLTRGRARYFFMTQEGKKILLFWLGPGEAFGGATLLQTPSSYVLSTEAVKESLVFVWDRATIRGLTVRYPRLLENTISVASDYLTWFLTTQVALTTNNARQRLARVLTCLAQAIGHEVPGGVEIDVSNEDLANAANMTPFTVSRLMSEWHRDRALIKRRGKILLRAPEQLHLRLHKV